MEWLMRAGWMVWPIGLCAVASLALFFERWFALSNRRVLPKTWCDQVVEALSEGVEPPDLDRVAAGRMVQAMRKIPSRRRERVQEMGQRLVAEMERGISWLGTIAALAPLLGLTGTVLGMIEVFQRMTVETGADSQVLAGGIWMALVTTVLGMLVAMPTLVLHRLLQGRVQARISELEVFADQILERDGS
jgi:biopolymer transport protein ExbB